MIEVGMAHQSAHIVWIDDGRQPHGPLIQAAERLSSEGVFSTLLYNPALTSRELLSHFHAAFPMVAPIEQVLSIRPDKICIFSWKECDEMHRLKTLPVPVVHFSSDIAIPLSAVLDVDKYKAPSFSLVIRSKNDADVVYQTLKGVQSQTIQPTECIIADCQSTDGTRDIIAESGYPVLNIPPEDYFPGKVLNQAIEKLSSDIVIFLNSDAVPLNPYLFEKLLAPFNDPDVYGAYGRQLPRPDACSWVIRDYLVAFPPDQAPSWMNLSLSCAAIRRKAWKLHPFYTKAWGSEDYEWGKWAKDQGHRIEYVPDSLVMHSHNYTFRQLYGRRFIEGEAEAIIDKNPYSFLNMTGDVIKSSVRDVGFHFHEKCFSEVLTAPFRRFVYYWGYYRGHNLGTKRRLQNDPDASLGQKTVLQRYKNLYK